MASFIQKYFEAAAPPPVSGHPYPANVQLHLNEMPRDIPQEIKDRILERFRELPLNRYPEPYAGSLAIKLAAWYGCAPGQLMVGPGSSAFIRLLLTYFGLHMHGRLVITRPSFAYYEQFCRAFGIAYDTWELDDNFQYDPALLDDLPEYSVVCLTTPNNPTGNSLTTGQMEALLTRHSTSLFVVDEAYAEFTEQKMLPLVARHSNIILLRTFSKAFGAAGVRLGAMIGPAPLISAILSLQTPWQLSAFTIEAAKVMLEQAAQTNWMAAAMAEVMAERENLFRHSTALVGGTFTVYPSAGNFLLFKAATARAHAALLLACTQLHLQVADLDHTPRLARCIRVTIGTPTENRIFIKALEQTVNKLSSYAKTG